MQNFDAAEEWLDHWAAQAGAQAERATQLARNVSSLNATAQSADMMLSVTVGSSGQLVDLSIDDRLALRGSALAQQIMALTRTAQAQLSKKVAEQVQGTVGIDTETGRAVVDAYHRRYPEPAPEARDGSTDWHAR